MDDYRRADETTHRASLIGLMSEIENALAGSCEFAERLESRLGPVLDPAATQPSPGNVPAAGADPHLPGLLAQANHLAGQARSLARRLDDLYERVRL